MRRKLASVAMFVVLGIGRTLSSPALQEDSASIIATVPGLCGIATDATGNIYALSAVNNSIVRFSAAGEPLGAIGPTLSHGYSLELSLSSPAIYVDASGKIYVPSGGRLLILDSSGTVLNLDVDGRLLPGFSYTGIISWIGVSQAGYIYVHRAMDDENSLVTVIAPTGRRVTSFGDKGLFSERLSHNMFHIAMGEDDSVHAIFSLFPMMMRYRPDYSFDGVFTLEAPGLAPGPSAASLEDTLQQVSEGKPVRVIMQAAESIGDRIVCISGFSLLWYGTSGKLLRTAKFNYTDYGGIITKVASGCGGRCLIGMSSSRDIIYRIEYH